MTVSRSPLETAVLTTPPAPVALPTPFSSAARGPLSFAAFVAFVALVQGAPLASAQQLQLLPPPSSGAAKLLATSTTPIPTPAQVALERGRQLQQSGETKLAEAQFRSALALAPQFGAAHRELARMMTSQCRWKDARSEWQSVLALSPNDQEAMGTLRQIESRAPSLGKTPVAPPSTIAQPKTQTSAETRPLPQGMAPAKGTASPRSTTATPAPPKVTPESGTVSAVQPPRIALNPPATVVVVAQPPALPKAATPVISAPIPKVGVRPSESSPAKPPLKLSFKAPARKKISWQRAKRAYIYVNEGSLLLKSKLPARALQAYQLGYDTDPYNPYAASGIATSLLIMKQFDAAAQAFARALAILPAKGKNADLRADAQRGLADTLTYGMHYAQALQANNTILGRKPQDFASLYQIAQIYTFANNYDQAKAYYQRALRVTPAKSRAEVLTSYGESLTYAGDITGAQTQLQAALKLDYKYLRARKALANASLYGGDYPTAISAYNTVIAAQPKDEDAHMGLGEALTFAGQPAKAIASFQTALLLKPNVTRAHLGLGRAYVVLRRFREALPELNVAVNAEPQNSDARLLLAIAQGETGDTQGALRNYDILLKQATLPLDQANINAAIGDLQANNRHPEAANAAYARALQLAPQNSDIALRSANYLLGQKRYDDARALAQSVLSREPASLRARIVLLAVEGRAGNKERAAALARQLSDVVPANFSDANHANFNDALLLVSALRSAGEDEASKRLLERLVQSADTDPASQLRLADTARDTGQFQQAVLLYGTYLAQNPDDANARIGLATVLSYDQKLDAAQSEIDRVLQTGLINDETRDEARILSATIASYRGTPESLGEAESRFLAALARDPKNVRALSGLGFTLSARGHYPEAIERYQAAIDLAPDDLKARLGLARNLNYARHPEASIAQYEDLLRRAPYDNTASLELAKIYLDNNRLADAENLYTSILKAGGKYQLNIALYIPAPNQKLVAFQPASQVDPSRVLPVLRRVDLKARSRHSIQKPLTLRLAQAAPDSAGTGQTGGGTTVTPPAGDPAVPDTAPTNEEGATPVHGTPPIVPVTPQAPLTTPPVSDNFGAISPAANNDKEQRLALRGLAEVRRRQGRFDDAIALFRQVLTEDAKDTIASLGLAQALRGAKDYQAALTEVEAVLAADEKKQNLTARVLHAQLLSDVGRGTEAQSELNSLTQSIENANTPPTLENYLALSEGFAGLGNYDSALAILERGQRDFSTESVLSQRQGEVLLAAKRFDDARAVFAQLVKANAENVDAQLGLARSYNYANRLTEAETTYRTVLQLESKSLAGRLELADILSRRGDYPQSITLYQSVLADAPDNLGARIEFARVLRYNRRYADSLEVLAQVLAKDPRSVGALTERGVLRGQIGDYEPGLADIEQAMLIAPDDLTAQLAKAEVLSYQGNYEESVRLYRVALERDPSNQKARTELGLALSYSGQNEAALKEINAVLQANPNNLDAQIARASSLGRARQYPESIAGFKAILVRSPQSQRAQLGLAEAYVAAGRFNDAIATYNGLLRLEPDNVNYAVARAQAVGYAGRTSEAVSALQTLLKANPGNLRARLALAEAMTNSRNRNLRAAAIREYRSILDTQPSNVSARFGLGRALSYQGDYDAADRELNGVLAIQPRNSEALYELAQAQRLENKPFDARDNYEKALSFDPRNSRARAGLDLVAHQTSPGVTPFFRYYNDTNGVRLRSYGIGPTVPFRFGTVGASYETGSFTDEGQKLRRHAINLLLSRTKGSLEARLLVSGVNYSNVDDGTGTRFLYDAFVQKSRRDGRQRLYGRVASREVIESLGSVNFDIRARNYEIGFAYPLGRFDAEGSLAHLEYSDDNGRNIATAALLYRILDNTKRGTFRVGVAQRYENSKFQPAIYLGEPLYYAPENFNSTSILADYQLFSNKLRMGLYGAYPLTDSQGDNGFGRPAKTLFGNVTYYPNRFLELFAEGGIVRSPDFDSNQANVGVTFRFH